MKDALTVCTCDVPAHSVMIHVAIGRSPRWSTIATPLASNAGKRPQWRALLGSGNSDAVSEHRIKSTALASLDRPRHTAKPIPQRLLFLGPRRSAGGVGGVAT